MKRLLGVGLICACGLAATAQGAPVVASKPRLTCPQSEMGNEDLQARYEGMWRQYSESVDTASNKLRAELEKQSKSATSSGNLDLALFWKRLTTQYDQTGDLTWDDSVQKKTWGDRFGDASFPTEFSIGVKKASEAYASAAKDLEKGYAELVAEFTKAEKLEEALKLRAEIKELLAEKSSVPQPTPAPKPKAEVKKADAKPKPVEKPVPVSPIVGMWINSKGWGNEFLADKTARNLNPKGQVDTVGTWKEEGQGRYSAQLASWQWQIVLRGDEIEIVRIHNGELKGHETLSRRR